MISLANLISAMEKIYEYIIGIFGTVFATITENAVLYLPVLVSIAAGVIFYVISLVRKFGVRGVGGGRRRRRG